MSNIIITIVAYLCHSFLLAAYICSNNNVQF